jgi:phosphoribosyl-ATP pyrophosphohydrolase
VKSFEDLWEELRRKAAERPAGSGSVALLDKGVHAIGKKLVEEAGETWIAAEYPDTEDLPLEVSQVLYYCQLIMLARGLTLEDVYKKL